MLDILYGYKGWYEFLKSYSYMRIDHTTNSFSGRRNANEIIMWTYLLWKLGREAEQTFVHSATGVD